MYKHLFGENIINTEVGRFILDKKRVKMYKYTINMETAIYHETIIQCSRGIPDTIEQ